MMTEKVLYDRKFAEEHPMILFVFTDNTDRSSGKNPISEDSWYAKKYGQGLCYPIITTAVLRGLPNAFPISTQRWYHKGAKGINGRWNDSDFNEFKTVIDDEINEIKKALASNKYIGLMFCSSIVDGHISDISLKRTPILYKYLVDKLKEIKGST